MGRRHLVLLALAPLACSLDGLDAYSSGVVDGSVDHSTPADAGSGMDSTADSAVADAPPGSDTAPPPACNLSKPFGAPTAVTELNTGVIDSQAMLTQDELTVYFSSNRLSAGSNTFTASRASKASPFSAPVALASLNYAGADTWNVTLTDDLLTAYVVTDEGGADHMYKATRGSKLVAFGAHTLMPAPVVEGEQPCVTPDGSVLYYADTKLTGKSQIVRATSLSGTPSTAVALSAVGSLEVAVPVVNPTETLLYFAAFDPAAGSPTAVFNSYDIWMSSRAKASDPWGTPVAVTELDTSVFESPSWISADGCELYFTRVPSGPNWDIYVARRP